MDEATKALALEALAQFPQTLAPGTWHGVPVLCGIETKDVYHAGSLGTESRLGCGCTLDKYRYAVEYNVQEAQRFATHVEQRPDGSARIVEQVAGEMRASVGQVVLREDSEEACNVTGAAFVPLPMPRVVHGDVVKTRKAFVASECAICLEEVAGSVTLIGCSNGHVLCGGCGGPGCRKLFRCPFCRDQVNVCEQKVVPLVQTEA